MAKNFGQKFIALQLGMLILGLVMFIGGLALKKSIAEKRQSQAVSVEGEIASDNINTEHVAPQQ